MAVSASGLPHPRPRLAWLANARSCSEYPMALATSAVAAQPQPDCSPRAIAPYPSLTISTIPDSFADIGFYPGKRFVAGYSATHCDIRPFTVKLAAAIRTQRLIQHSQGSEELRTKSGRNCVDDTPGALLHQLVNSGTHLSSVASDGDVCGTAIFGSSTHPLHQLLRLKLLEHACHGTGRDAGVRSQIRKTCTLLGGQSTKNAALPRSHTFTTNFIWP